MYSETDYFCVLENGGKQLLRFTQLAHEHISAGKMNILSEWQPVVRIILKQMVECIEFMLSANQMKECPFTSLQPIKMRLAILR